MQDQEISNMPQLDGPGSLLMRDPIGQRTHEVTGPAKQESSQGDTHIPLLEEENIEGKIVIMMVLEGHIEIGDPLMKEDILTKVGDPLTEEDTLIEDPLEEDILIEMGDHMEEEDTLVEDPLMEMEDPLMMEDLLVIEDPLDLLVDKDHWALRYHLDQSGL